MRLQETLARKAGADLLIERAVSDLSKALHAAAGALQPFPLFPDSTTQAIEAEPGGPAKTGLGCVAVCPDGELNEFRLAVSFEAESGTVDKREDLREISLAPQDYIPYAYTALTAITRLLVERTEEEGLFDSPLERT